VVLLNKPARINGNPEKHLYKYSKYEGFLMSEKPRYESEEEKQRRYDRG